MICNNKKLNRIKSKKQNFNKKKTNKKTYNKYKILKKKDVVVDFNSNFL